MSADHGGLVAYFVGKFDSGLRQCVHGMREAELGALVHRQVGPMREETRSVDDVRCACCKDGQTDVGCHHRHRPRRCVPLLVPFAVNLHGECL